MTDFIKVMDGRIDESIRCLALSPPRGHSRAPPATQRHQRVRRPAWRPAWKMLVVQGPDRPASGGRSGRKVSIQTVQPSGRTSRSTPGTAPEDEESLDRDEELDAWLIWNICNRQHGPGRPRPITEEYQVYRDAGSALTQHGKTKAAALSATPVRWTRPSALDTRTLQGHRNPERQGASPGGGNLIAWSTPPHKVPHAAIGVPTSARTQ